MDFFDTLTLDAPTKTNSGFMIASVKVARTGIQIYSGREVDPENKHGMRDRAQVRVYRSEDQVFDKSSLATLAHKPLTVNHPPKAVTADNWREYSVGSVGDEIARDGDFIRVPIAIMDGRAIKQIEGGKNQLSCGYSCELVFGDGMSPNGEQYDAAQTGIRYNHLSVVDLARGGDKLKIGDEKPMKTILIDGHSVEVSDAAEIAIAGLNKRLEAADAKVATLTTDAAGKDTKIAELTTQVATKDAEIVTLKKQVDDAKVTPAQMNQMVKDLADTRAVGAKIAPKAAITDGMGANEIKKIVVSAKLGDAAKDWSDEQIAVSFDTLKAALPAANQVRDAGREIPRDQNQTTDSRTAWQKMVDGLTNPETAKAS